MAQDDPWAGFETVEAPAPRARAGVTTIVPGKPKQDDPPSGYRWAANGELEAIPGGPAAGRLGGDRKAEADLRKEFNARPEVKDFNAIRNSYFQIRDLGQKASAQNDLGLIFTFMKMLDPQSVVREGEFATAQNAAGVPDQVRNMWNKTLSGERLNDNQRREMIGTAKSIFGRRLSTYNDLAGEYRRYAQDYEVEPDRVATLAMDEANAPTEQATGKPDPNAPLPSVRDPDADVEVSPTGEMRYSTKEDREYNAKIQAMFDRGASATQLRAFARQHGYELPGVEKLIEYRDRGGKGATFITPETGYRGPSALGAMAASPVGAAFAGAANALTAGTLDEIVGATGGDAEQAQFAKELMRREHPIANFAGELGGGALALTGLGRVPGLAGRALLTDTLGGAAYGAGENNENRAAGALVGGGAAALGSWGGSKLINKLTGRAAPRSTPTAPAAPSQAAQRVAGAEKFGIDLPLGATGRMASGIEKGLDILPGSAGVMQAGRDQLGEQVGSAVDDVAARFGPTTSFEGTGEAAQRGAKAWISKFEETSGKAYDAIPVSGKAPADLANTRAVLEDLTTKFQSNPKLADAMRNTRLERYMDALGETDAPLSWEDLKAFRSRIGEEIGDARFSDGTLKSELRALYGSLSEDMKNTAAAQGPKALRAFERANDLYRKGQERIDTALISILGDDSRKSPGAAAKALQNLATSGKASSDLKKLSQIRASMPKEEWGEVANGMMRLLGQPVNSEGREFSAQTFIRNYDDMSDGAKNLLFGDRGRKELRESLDEFSGVMRNLADNNALRNTSNTANAVNATALISSGPAALLNPLVAAGIGGQALGSYGLSKLWTNPRFVKWATGYAKMVNGAQKAGGQPNVGRQLGLLQKVAAAEPAIASELSGLRQSILSAANENAPTVASSAASDGADPKRKNQNAAAK